MDFINKDWAKSLFAREKSISISIQTDDGCQISIDMKNVNEQNTMKLLEDLLAG